MNQHVIKISIGCAAALLITPVQPVRAQTNDEARLVLGMAAGYIGSTLLWDVPNQTMLSSFDSPSVFHLRRSTSSDITISGNIAYFKSPHIGVTGDFTYVGLGNTDGCSIVHDGGDGFLQAACDAVKEKTNSASIVVVNAGLILRPLSRADFQPYVKVLGGLAFTPSSTIAMQSLFGIADDTSSLATIIYEDDSWKSIRPTWTVGLGVSTAPSSGFQLHLEVRQTWIPMGIVTDAAPFQGQIPPHRTEIKGFPSVLIGFDIVLARQRGRRY